MNQSARTPDKRNSLLYIITLRRRNAYPSSGNTNLCLKHLHCRCFDKCSPASFVLGLAQNTKRIATSIYSDAEFRVPKHKVTNLVCIVPLAQNKQPKKKAGIQETLRRRLMSYENSRIIENII